jgi:hypothetical protein
MPGRPTQDHGGDALGRYEVAKADKGIAPTFSPRGRRESFPCEGEIPFVRPVPFGPTL